MNWRDDFRDNSVWTAAEAVTNSINEAIASGDIDATDPRTQQLRDLIARVCAQSDDPHVEVTQRSLGVVQSALDQIRGALPNLQAAAFSPAREHGNSPRFDVIAAQVRTWPQSGTGKLTGLRSQIAELEDAAESMMQRVASRIGEVEQQLIAKDDDIQRIVNQSRDESRAAISAVEARMEEFKTEVHELRQTAREHSSRIDIAIRDHQEQFTSDQKEREDEFKKTMADASTRANSVIAAMNSHEQKSRDVLAAVGINSTATHYGSHARDQAKLANRWRVIASIILAAAGIWFVASSIFPELHGDGALWEQAVSRLGITGAVAGVGIYAARESSQHRTQERKSRATELVITALEPFIANLDEESKQQIRNDAAKALFVDGHKSAIGLFSSTPGESSSRPSESGDTA